MASMLCILIFVSGCMESSADLVPDFLSFKKKTVEELSPSDLAEWTLVGVGEALVDEEKNALMLAEGNASKGITLLSKRSYKSDVTFSFEIRPLSFEGVSYVFLSASDVVTMGELKVSDEHLGNINFWTEGRVQNYLFSFHNGFFESKPFIKKNPGLKDVAISPDVFKGKESYNVEVGRRGRRLWIKIDGKTVARGSDKARGGLPPGRLGFRLRGHGAGAYRCMIRNVVISEG